MAFLINHGLPTAMRQTDRKRIINFGALGKQKNLPAPKDKTKQAYSQRYVDFKRAGRSYSAIFGGMSVKSATAAGLVDPNWTEPTFTTTGTVEGEKSLFVQGDSDDEMDQATTKPTPSFNPAASAFKPRFGTTSSNPFGAPSTSRPDSGFNPFAAASSAQPSFKSPFAKDDDEEHAVPTFAPFGGVSVDAATSGPSLLGATGDKVVGSTPARPMFDFGAASHAAGKPETIDGTLEPPKQGPTSTLAIEPKSGPDISIWHAAAAAVLASSRRISFRLLKLLQRRQHRFQLKSNLLFSQLHFLRALQTPTHSGFSPKRLPRKLQQLRQLLTRRQLQRSKKHLRPHLSQQIQQIRLGFCRVRLLRLLRRRRRCSTSVHHQPPSNQQFPRN